MGDGAIEVGLVRMEGKIDRIGDALQRGQEDIRDVKIRLHGHANRITVLEADKHIRNGALGTLKWIWGGGIATACAVFGIGLKVFGVFG